MASVAISRVKKAFGAVMAVDDVSVDIEDGEFVVLVGPSGCGKSTLLRMVAGLEDITEGKIEIEGQVVNDLPPKKRDIAMVFQNYALYPHMTVAQNMGFSLKFRGVARSDIERKVADAAATLGLESLLQRKPGQLSGGQRQRVAMGRAIVRDPKVFLFDEPLSNLDAKLRVQMRSEIKALHQRLATTVTYVTHDQIEAMSMADKIVVMRSGRIEQVGAPLEVFDRPSNTFVAGFIGSPAMNFIEGSVREGKFVVDGGIGLPLPDQNGSKYKDKATTYGIRPEHFRLDDNGIESEVLLMEPMGSETLIVFRLGNHPVNCVFHERLNLPSGSKVRVSPIPDAVHLFDAGGQRLG